MKIIYSIAILVASISSLSAELLGPFAPAEITIRGAGQNLNYALTSSKTNIVGSTTNITQAFKSTTTNFTMNAGSLMALLENSLNTNFPAGCQLLLTGGGSYYYLVVSDTSGTNLGLNPSQVLLPSPLSAPLPVHSGADTQTSSNKVVLIIDGKDAESFTSALTFTYDDTALTNTADGTHTKFTWVGLVHNQTLQEFNPTSGFYNENITMDIIGSGLIRFSTNASPEEQGSAIFTGSIRAKLSGS